MVPPSSLQESSAQALRAGEQGALCQLHHHGAALHGEPRFLPQDQAEAQELLALVAQSSRRPVGDDAGQRTALRDGVLAAGSTAYLPVAQLRLAMLLLRISATRILWVAIPTAAEMAGRLGEKLLLYQVSDKYDANEDSALSAQVIRGYDRRLKDAADVVLYSGRKLFSEATEPNRFFLEQAVDFEHFSRLQGEPAPELVGIPHPILGYFGTMDYVMDTELMAEVARLRPDWHWVMLGLRSNLVRVSAPNIHFLGSKPYRDLPRYIGQFDVCVLPWRETNTFTSYGSAIKVREYLATGKPVVMAPAS